MRRRFNDLADQAAGTYRTAYNTAREYPGTLAAVIVGIGVTAFLLWAARRAGGWRNLQDSTVDRMREGYDYVRDRAARVRSEASQIAE